MVDNTKLSFLPEDKGENVIKFNLREGNKENARAVLYLPEGSKVIKHTHNEDSEVYVDILKIMQVINGDETLKGHTLTEVLKIVEDYGCPAHIKNWFETLLASATKVAGQNSPTGDLGHEIAPSKNPQIYLAIKKGKEEKNWDQLDCKKNKNCFAYFDNLDFDCQLKENELVMLSGQEQELVKINTNNQVIEYKNRLTKSTKVQVNMKDQTFTDITNMKESLQYQSNQGAEMQ